MTFRTLLFLTINILTIYIFFCTFMLNSNLMSVCQIKEIIYIIKYINSLIVGFIHRWYLPFTDFSEFRKDVTG